VGKPLPPPEPPPERSTPLIYLLSCSLVCLFPYSLDSLIRSFACLYVRTYVHRDPDLHPFFFTSFLYFYSSLLN
jgi:hypothetical protein